MLFIQNNCYLIYIRNKTVLSTFLIVQIKVAIILLYAHLSDYLCASTVGTSAKHRSVHLKFTLINLFINQFICSKHKFIKIIHKSVQLQFTLIN